MFSLLLSSFLLVVWRHEVQGKVHLHMMAENISAVLHYMCGWEQYLRLSGGFVWASFFSQY